MVDIASPPITGIQAPDSDVTVWLLRIAPPSSTSPISTSPALYLTAIPYPLHALPPFTVLHPTPSSALKKRVIINDTQTLTDAITLSYLQRHRDHDHNAYFFHTSLSIPSLPPADSYHLLPRIYASAVSISILLPPSTRLPSPSTLTAQALTPLAHHALWSDVSTLLALTSPAPKSLCTPTRSLPWTAVEEAVARIRAVLAGDRVAHNLPLARLAESPAAAGIGAIEAWRASKGGVRDALRCFSAYLRTGEEVGRVLGLAGARGEGYADVLAGVVRRGEVDGVEGLRAFAVELEGWMGVGGREREEGLAEAERLLEWVGWPEGVAQGMACGMGLKGMLTSPAEIGGLAACVQDMAGTMEGRWRGVCAAPVLREVQAEDEVEAEVARLRALLRDLDELEGWCRQVGEVRAEVAGVAGAIRTDVGLSDGD